MTAILVLALVVALILITWLLVYKAQHQYPGDDIEKARKDALDRSHSIVSGKVAEHMAPFFPELLSQFNPRDARFVGGPVDFIFFDGLDGGGDVERVVFVEVKTGRAGLDKRERRVRDAIEARRVEFQLFRVPSGEMGETAQDGLPALDAPPALQP